MKTAWISNLLEDSVLGLFLADFVDRGIATTCILFMKYTISKNSLLIRSCVIYYVVYFMYD